MKILIRLALFGALFFCYSPTQAQKVLKNLGNRVKQKVESRANRKVDQTIDKGLDKAENSTKGSKEKEDSPNDDGTNDNSNASVNSSSSSSALTYKSKFDFIPGEKVIAVEDFSQDAIGDFPGKWNTNSTGEIVNVDGQEGKWLMLNKEGAYLPEFINSLPENFTLEMDIASNKDFSYYSTGLDIAMAKLNNANEFTNWLRYKKGKNGVLFWIHPTDAGNDRGRSGYGIWNKGEEIMKNDASTALFHGRSGKNVAHLSIWRQKDRLRVYLDAEKIWDIPKAFASAESLNALVFSTHSFSDENDRYFIKDIRLAVGAPDTRNKLITVGKFVTAGILFDVNSDDIKPQSFGIIKEIAGVLKENNGIKIKIIGHTDSDGETEANLELSKKRAAAVKNSLVKDFDIEAGRIETDGKGESDPAVDNNSDVNKAQNRRVEFVKQ